MPKVYIGMGADLLYPGHLNIIENAQKYAGNYCEGLTIELL